MDNSGKNSSFPALFADDTLGQLSVSFSRHGGVSSAPFFSNNVSFGVGDKDDNITVNRQRVKEVLGLNHLVSAHQVHGRRIFHVDGPVYADYEVDEYDGLITDQQGVGLLIQHADCQPVLLYDPSKRVIAAIHNGWRGSVENIIAVAIAEMNEHYGCHPAALLAAVGPSLGPCCSEFVNFEKELPQSFRAFQVRRNYFDFWQITLHQLMQCGVPEVQVSISGICTSCSRDYFSYRRARKNGSGITGRNGTVMALVANR